MQPLRHERGIRRPKVCRATVNVTMPRFVREMKMNHNSKGMRCRRHKSPNSPARLLFEAAQEPCVRRLKIALCYVAFSGEYLINLTCNKGLQMVAPPPGLDFFFI